MLHTRASRCCAAVKKRMADLSEGTAALNEEMFDKVTRRLIQKIDHDRSLIPVSQLNDSEKLKPLCVVIKTPPSWPWQKPKYKPTDFNLNDLLKDNSIKLELERKEFLNYEEQKESSVAGLVEVDMGCATAKSNMSKSCKLVSSLGKLDKESLNIPVFLKNSKDRYLDMTHYQIKHITESKPNKVFGIVKERIVTTSACTLEYTGKEKGSIMAKTLNIIPHVKSWKGGIDANSDTKVAVTIPPNTVLAYSVKELTINKDGSFELCAESDGFDDDGEFAHPSGTVSEVDGLWKMIPMQKGFSLFALKKNLADVRNSLCVLAQLPSELHATLVQSLQELLLCESSLSELEDRLEKLCGKEPLVDLPPTSSELTDMLLDKLQSATASSHQEKSKAGAANHQHESVLPAMHMLISAANALTEDGLNLLQELWSRELILPLNYLVNSLTNDSQPLALSNVPYLLMEDIKKVTELFGSCNITMRMNDTELLAESGSDNNILPLVLCIVICGLAYLSDTCE